MDSSNSNIKDYNFARRTNWRNPNYQYIKNSSIIEWDIKSAGLSVIKFQKLLPEEEINKLESMSKKMRTVREGLYQREYPIISEKIVKTLENVRQAFTFLNKIPEDNVLTIKKDALFLINCNPKITTIKEFFNFRKKGEYTSFICLNRNEFYLTLTGELEVKGIGEESFRKQEKYFLKDIKYLLSMSEKVSPEQMLNILINYRSKYLNMELPIDTYRELDSGLFRIKGNSGGSDDCYLANEIDESLKDSLDISQNFMNYLVPMFNLLL